MLRTRRSKTPDIGGQAAPSGVQNDLQVGARLQKGFRNPRDVEAALGLVGGIHGMDRLVDVAADQKDLLADFSDLLLHGRA